MYILRRQPHKTDGAAVRGNSFNKCDAVIDFLSACFNVFDPKIVIGSFRTKLIKIIKINTNLKL